MSDQFAVRVQMRSVRDGECAQCAIAGHIFYDSFTVITAQTPLSQLVTTVLNATGYQHLSKNARGLIQLKEWKPLQFDQLTDDPDSTVESLALRDLSNHITLIIITNSDDENRDKSLELRDQLLKTIIHRHPETISSINNQQLKDFVHSIIEGCATSTSEELVTSFNCWLEEVVKCTYEQTEYSANNNNNNNTMPPLTSRFHQTFEVPKLQLWFEQNPNPTRSKLQQYMQILNSSPIRQHNHKILYQQICQWFTNARAVLRRNNNNITGRINNNNNNPDANPENGDQDLTDHTNSDSPSITVTVSEEALSPVSKIFRPAESSDLMAVNAFLCNRILQEAQQRLLAQHAGALQINTTHHLNKANIGLNVLHCEENGGGSNEPSPASSSSNKLMKNEEHDYDSETPPSETQLAPVSPMDSHSQFMSTDSHQQTLSPMDFLRARGISQVGGFQSMQLQAAAVAAASIARNQHSAMPKRSPCGSIANAGMGRSRLMFDPLTELPLLEQWFEENPHPSWIQIDQFTHALNQMTYRKTYPPVTTHNVKIWFKNRRAKCKRMLGANNSTNNNSSASKEVKDDISA